MCMQKTILEEYHKAYPHHTIRQIAQTTGLRMTRVFRLLNGHEMKTKEFEAFQNSLPRKTLKQTKTVDQLLEEAKSALPEESIQYITHYIESKLAMKRIVETSIHNKHFKFI